mgnify:CR=1 FL=1
MIRRKGYPHVSKSFTKKSTASTWAKQTELDMVIRMRKPDNKKRLKLLKIKECRQ